jgi:hypothetical protein
LTQSVHQVHQGQRHAVDFGRIGFGDYTNMSLACRVVWGTD